VLPIIAASTVQYRRGALQVATLSALLYLGIVALQFMDVSAYFPEAWSLGGTVLLPTPRFAQFTVAINLFGFFAAALLAGSLGERLRSANARLKDASHAMEDLRAFNERVIDSLVSGLVTADLDRRIVTFNRGAQSITGLAPAQAIGHDAAEVFQMPAPFSARLTTLTETRSARADLEFRRHDGRTIEIGITATTLTFPSGQSGYLFTFQDVTDIKRLERNARLQQRLAAVGEMAAGIAHEIRNPLASMSGSLQLLRQELPLSEEQTQLMDIVLRESDRLNDTIRSFLAYARPQRFVVSRLDVTKVVQDTAMLLRNSADVREGHVVDVEAPDAPVWYEADENQIRQIIWNLATNGLRAMTSGGRLLLGVAAEAHEVVLSVADQGCGIPPDELDGIFQPFKSSFEKGTGLGLAIVHRIVTDYNGAVQVSSTVGVGTTVRVKLPVHAAMAVAQ
jgi:two-component system sensor histidine kinase PilS (NtrC family)